LIWISERTKKNVVFKIATLMQKHFSNATLRVSPSSILQQDKVGVHTNYTTRDMFVTRNSVLYDPLSCPTHSPPLEIELPPDRVGRRDIHQYLNTNFPLLKTSITPHPQARDKDHQVLQLIADTSMHGLLSLGISALELEQLYGYLRLGRSEGVDRGVYLGHDIDKQGRTEAYRVISQLYRGIESKTVNVRGGGGKVGWP
jgi:hypothetical protein